MKINNNWERAEKRQKSLEKNDIRTEIIFQTKEKQIYFKPKLDNSNSASQNVLYFINLINETFKNCLYVKRRTEEGKCRQLEVNKIRSNFATRYFHLVSVFEQQRICLKTMLAGKENQKFLHFIVENVEKIFSKNNTSVFRCLEKTEVCNFSHGSKTGKQILQEMTEDLDMTGLDEFCHFINENGNIHNRGHATNGKLFIIA